MIRVWKPTPRDEAKREENRRYVTAAFASPEKGWRTRLRYFVGCDFARGRAIVRLVGISLFRELVVGGARLSSWGD